MTTYEPDPVAAEIAAILRGYRARLGLNQAELAAATGIDQSHWSALERGKRAMTIDQMAAACRLMNLSMEQVMDEAERSVIRSQEG
ncbi:MAG: helix-turn-helix transcriptional regulator [Nocardioidaceae bacterium]|nr:helix-turn-helix transcriptional regulator [Nocardioidaceae bacterium]